MLGEYYRLTKPGIIRGNLLTALAGFFLASQHNLVASRLAGLVFGLGLVIASACVANNYLDRGIDARMQRTRQRALVTGIISNRAAITYCILLTTGGVALLLWLTNVRTAGLAISGWLAYVFLYGYAKRRTIFSTLIGALPGALPPLIGYSAAGQSLGLTALLLFAILVCWQLPHFYAIAIYRQQDYQTAGIPLMPARRGWQTARRRIIAYIIVFCGLVGALAVWGPASTIYLLPTTLIALAWLLQALRPGNGARGQIWARRVFGWSLLSITIWSASLIFDSIL